MSNITIKTAEEIELMRESGRLLAKVFAMLDTFIVPGITTMEINDKVEDYIFFHNDVRTSIVHTR